MTRRVISVLILIVTSTWPLQAQQRHTTQGATLGGVAGAIAGGIIGHQNDETPEGALIGGAVGAIAGGLLGNAKDAQVARDHHYQHQLWHQQQQITQMQQRLQAVSLAEVVQMSRSGLSDAVIMNHVRTHGVAHQLTAREIIDLHRNGVSEPVITAMQQAPRSYPVQTVARVSPPRPTTVVVEREYHVAPRYPVYPQYRYATRPVGPRSGWRRRY